MERIDRLLKGDESTYITQLPAKGSVSVDLQDAAFQWGQDKFALKPAALQINSGEFAVVVGRIGSGKSSLLSAICGEMPLTSGRGYVYGRIGYVSQKPWIMNTTLRENILCGRPFDQDFYRSVIDACALADDIKLFPAKDLSEIGHKGINLSGGQKVRLALARAVYSRADIYVLDDLLAAVDAYVERQLVDNVLVGNGILAGKTRILVTHAEHIVPYADKVMTLEDGHTTSMRHYASRVANNIGHWFR
ncbi:Canalicular multispecific organic anion transporter 1 [Linderina macrospora]|uniref:Canalicular multispecific organic anion transporter 1 n=1 Tax=Linderina macrospora TaxID=4868 RepID=A0ACC1J9V2_9FUNG|nr:Canalicular multispecific organic anion transporter 1 [Linderina macrospora]